MKRAATTAGSLAMAARAWTRQRCGQALVLAVLALAPHAALAAAPPECHVAPNLPGMGDNMFTMHFGVIGPDVWNGMRIVTTPDQAKQMMLGFKRLSNGAPFCIMACVLTEYDHAEAWRDLARFAASLGGHMGVYTSLNYAWNYPYPAGGRFYRNASKEKTSDADFIPEYARSLDAKGNWIKCWDQGQYNRLYGVSAQNMWDHVDPNGKSAMQNRCDDFMKHWGADTIMAMHWDYHCNPQPNGSTVLGGKITTGKQELEAFDKTFEYLWTQHGVSACVETEPAIPSRMACMYHSRHPDTKIPDRITNRNRVLGMTEYGWDEDRLEFVGFAPVAKTGYVKPFTKVRSNFYKYMLLYAHNQKTRDFASAVQGGVTLYKGVDPKNHSVIGDRFVPQVGVGCRVIAYSEKGGTDTWALPSAWKGIAAADVYRLTAEKDPALEKENVAVAGAIELTMAADAGYAIVPHGWAPTPVRVNFDDLKLKGGDVLKSHGGIAWDAPGSPPVKVQGRGPDSVSGGMGTFSVYLDDAGTGERSARIGLPAGGVLHSLRVGNKGGQGRISIRSSAADNAAATFDLPPAGQTALIETNWQKAETGKATIAVTCSGGAKNVLLDDFAYGVSRAAP